MKHLHPDIIVNVTGSSPLLSPIKGLHDVIEREGGKVSSILNMINYAVVGDYPEDMKGKSRCYRQRRSRL